MVNPYLGRKLNYHSIKNLKDIVNDYETWNEYVQIVSGLNDIIPKMEKALERKDNILIGTLLDEVSSVFEEMLIKLQILKLSVMDEADN